jgi:phosphatidylserine/phosphatidylglycerophosphate/cardiolipin synthase-like enzyme
MRSPDADSFSIELSPSLMIEFTINDLTSEEQQAVEILRRQDAPAADGPFLPESVSNLVSQYQGLGYADNSAALRQIDIETTDSPLQWVIGRGDRYNRATLERIITEAQRFLLISSYVIEDERITRLICEKAATLPEGVWILTDLRDEVINYLDTQVENNLSTRFEKSHEFKRYCIMNLLNAGVHIRSGRFHLKTVISEQSAYLGSCNLTCGSLAFNLEAGLRVQNNTLHRELLQKFQYCWEANSQDIVSRTGRQDKLMLQSVPPSTLQFSRSLHLLYPGQYYEDLQQELSQFQGQVSIYSRSFKPEAILEQRLLSHSCETRLFIETDHASPVKSKFKVTPIRYLHAKVTILGDRVAYVGGVNFNFERQSRGLVDLMYKTTQPDEIQQLRYALARFS